MRTLILALVLITATNAYAQEYNFGCILILRFACLYLTTILCMISS
jgi:hypothetical protein